MIQSRRSISPPNASRKQIFRPFNDLSTSPFFTHLGMERKSGRKIYDGCSSASHAVIRAIIKKADGREHVHFPMFLNDLSLLTRSLHLRATPTVTKIIPFAVASVWLVELMDEFFFIFRSRDKSGTTYQEPADHQSHREFFPASFVTRNRLFLSSIRQNILNSMVLEDAVECIKDDFESCSSSWEEKFIAEINSQ